MSKFNAGRASVLALTAVSVLASFLLGKSLTKVVASTTHQNYKAGTWSSCVAKPDHVCGDNAGTQSATCQTTNGSAQDGCTSLGQVVTKDCNITCQKINICHKTDSESNPYEAKQVDDNGYLAGHPDDFLYEGPTKEDGKPDNKDKQADKWCKDHVPSEVVDVCPNLSGDQAIVPPNMEINTDNNCSCLS